MSHFVDDRHNLYVGWVMGIAARHGFMPEPVRDEAGNYTDRITLPIGDHEITVVVPPPPADWVVP